MSDTGRQRPCPSCERVEMWILPVKGVELDVCPTCRGAWFDAGELTAVLGGKRVGALLSAARQSLPSCRACEREVENGTCVSCADVQPACVECGTREMVGVVDRGVRLDVCNGCGGMWLDEGELEIISGGKAPDLTRLLAGPKQAQDVPSSRVSCSACARVVRKVYAFKSGTSAYCGSCAPGDSSPYEVDLRDYRRKELFGDPWESDYRRDPDQEGFELADALSAIFRWFR
ncbi:MAG: zf-TFIIB domain-containing protein [Myxococcales bacterium]